MSENSKNGRSSSDLGKAFEAKAEDYMLGTWQIVQHGGKTGLKLPVRVRLS